MHSSRRHEMVAIVNLTRGGRVLVAHFIGSWVRIVAHLGVGRKTIFYVRRQLNPDSLVIDFRLFLFELEFAV